MEPNKRRIKYTLFIALAVSLFGCQGRHGGFEAATFVTTAGETKVEENTTGFSDFDHNKYSVDGDQERTEQATEDLLAGAKSGSPSDQKLAENNAQFAASIEAVQFHRINSEGVISRLGQKRFRIEITSTWPQANYQPIIFEGDFSLSGNILKINNTLSKSHGKTFQIQGAIDEQMEKNKVFSSLDLFVYNEDETLEARSKINTRSYVGIIKVRTPNDMEKSAKVDQQVDQLKGSVAWVSNTVVVLGRAFYKYDIIKTINANHPLSINEIDNGTSLISFSGDSLQTNGFVTKEVNKIDESKDSEVSPSSAALFGANDDGLRSFKVDLPTEQQGKAQDIILEVKEKDDFSAEELSPEVRDLKSAASQSNNDTIETEEALKNENSLEDNSYPRRPKIKSSEETQEEANTNSSYPRRPKIKKYQKQQDVDSSESNENAQPGFGTKVKNFFTGFFKKPARDKNQKPDIQIDEFTPLRDENGSYIDPYEKPKPIEETTESPAPSGPPRRSHVQHKSPLNNKNKKEELSKVRPKPRPESLNVSTAEQIDDETEVLAEGALESSPRPRPRPKNLSTSKPKVRKNMPDIKIEGIEFGLSQDAFLKINYDTKNLPRVAQGLLDMEQNYAYPEIRNKWIPYMRDKRKKTIQNFWQNAYPVRDLIAQVFEYYDVLPTLAYVTILESTFLRSGKFEVQLTTAGLGTAYGPFQLLKSTASVLGLKTDTKQARGHKPASWDERNWFVPSLCGAAKHFSNSLEAFGHADATWAILAYHAGDKGASDEIADSLKIGRGELWKNIDRYSFTYQEIKGYNKIDKKYVDYVDQKVASYFILQSPQRMKFSTPSNVSQQIPAAYRSRFFPQNKIKDSTCEEAAQGWRSVFQ
ncbi:MAG: hypothetical protein KDD34_08540 [Bdellovibrionales bacterium]|nr:hypothetical protein [Bdellovibrionales bacterium]